MSRPTSLTGAIRVRFDVLALLLWIFAFFIEGIILLASLDFLGQVPPTTDTTALSDLGISLLYVIFLVGGMVMFFIAGNPPSFEIGSQLRLLADGIVGAPIVVFAISSVAGIASGVLSGSQSIVSLFSTFKYTYSLNSQQTTILGVVTNPIFFSSWVASNAIAEETTFLPAYFIMRRAFGSTPFGAGLAQVLNGGLFTGMHVVKYLVLFGGDFTIPVYAFFISAFIVRIALNEITYLVKDVLPAFLGHSIFDVIGVVFFGAV